MAQVDGFGGRLIRDGTCAGLGKWSLDYVPHKVEVTFKEVQIKEEGFTVQEVIDTLKEHGRLLMNLVAFTCNLESNAIPMDSIQGFRTYRNNPTSNTLTITLRVHDHRPFEKFQIAGTVVALFKALLGKVPMKELPILLVHENECIRLGAKEILEEL